MVSSTVTRPSVRWLILVLVAVLAITSRAAFAQTPVQQQASNVLINYTEVIDTPDQQGVTLRVFFELTDSTNRVVPGAQVKSATFTLDPVDGGNVVPKVSQATGPISLVLALDTSGSMGPTMQKMQQAATQLVEGLPQGSRIAVIQFSSNVNVVQDFTTDKKQVESVIGQAKAGGNTCLYDAIFEGVSHLASGTTGRRAVIVFTDGVDETNVGKVCSTHTIDDIIKLATDRKVQVPVYSIGFQGGGRVAEPELRNISDSTHGELALGKDLGAIFKQIQDALNAQLVAEALVHPKDGDRTVTLKVVLNDGSVPNLAATTFTSPKDYSVKPPTITPTFPPPTLKIINVQEDDDKKLFLVQVTVKDEQLVKEYHLDLINPSGTLQKETISPAPLNSPVEISFADLVAGEYTVLVNAIASDGSTIIAHDEYKVRFTPTVTPTFTPSGTPQPISATIQSITYVDATTKQDIAVTLNLLGQDQITRLSASLADAHTQITVRTYDNVSIAPQLTLSLKDIPGGEYVVNVFTYAQGGAAPTISSAHFVHTLTPTPTPSFTPSSTPVVVSAVLGAPQVDQAAAQLVFSVQTANETQIASYKVQLINESTNLVQKEYTFKTPPYDTVKLPFSDLEGGKYTVNLQALDANGQPVAPPTQSRFEFTPPTATPTVTPTPTETPRPTGLIPALSDAFADPGSRPIVIIVFVVVVLVILGAIVLLVRGRPKKPATGTGFLREMTGSVDISQMAAYQNQGKKAPPPSSDRDKTAPVPTVGGYGGDADKTSPIPFVTVPTATLSVESSRDTSMIGKRVTVATMPFTLGRLKRDLNFNNDDNVSREHAEIIYQDDSFYVVDKGSTHHTYVDDAEIKPDVPTMIYNGSTIRLGTATVIRFTVDEGGDEISNRTNIIKR